MYIDIFNCFIFLGNFLLLLCFLPLIFHLINFNFLLRSWKRATGSLNDGVVALWRIFVAFLLDVPSLTFEETGAFDDGVGWTHGTFRDFVETVNQLLFNHNSTIIILLVLSPKLLLLVYQQQSSLGVWIGGGRTRSTHFCVGVVTVVGVKWLHTFCGLLVLTLVFYVDNWTRFIYPNLISKNIGFELVIKFCQYSFCIFTRQISGSYFAIFFDRFLYFSLIWAILLK